MTRDRDGLGRPLKGGRDGLGRPLPRGVTGVEALPEDLSLSPDQSIELAQQLLDAERPFQAHEVLEAVWKRAAAAERDLWQGLAQLAVAVTHAGRGNQSGASALLARGAGRLEPYSGTQPYGVDVAALIDWARSASAELDRPGDHRLPPLRLRITA